jgi:hypothetical protein
MSNSAVIDRCVEGAALAPINSEQRRELAILARRAFERLYDAGDISESTDFDAWRHQQSIQAVERPGLRDCRQEDYGQLKGWFLRLLGQPAMADRMQVRADLEPRRVALFKLRQECQAVADVIGNAESYVAAIARVRFKVSDLKELGEKQLWILLFDLRRNAQRRRKQGRAA